MVRCKNYLICKNDYILKDNLCMECNCLFGEWRKRRRKYIEMEERINKLCLNCNCISDIFLKRMDCDHVICLECFNYIYFGKEMKRPVMIMYNIQEYKNKFDKYKMLKNLYSTDKMMVKCDKC